MKHHISTHDIEFLSTFESCRLEPSAFRHREHIRLAYTLLVQFDLDEAHSRLKSSLLEFLAFNGVDKGKYHETMTHAWLLAVRHFMYRSEPALDADDFIRMNPALLDKDIMLTHYSRELLGSGSARNTFVEPDLERIPLHGARLA